MEFIKNHRRRLETLSYNCRAFFAGSSTEIPAAYFLTNPTDIDYMMYRTDVCAVPKNAKPPRNFRGEVMTIDPDGPPAGYVRIKNVNQEYEKHLQKYDYHNPTGPAITKDVGWAALTFDRVLSVQCPYWPPEAQEWQTRNRPHGWPSKDLIDQIVSEGCFLVGKSHPNCKDNDDTQWRYSFSKAEMRLISSWTDSQQYVYHVLRLIKSEIVEEDDDKKKTGLSTYHFKTQMFWACEEKPAGFWEDSNLLTCICELLTQIHERFTAGNFPNYFMPDCNIAEGLFSEYYLSEAIEMLNTRFVQNFLKSNLPPKVCNECRFSISFPVEMGLYFHFLAVRCGIPFQVHRLKLDSVQQLIDEELNDLMNGIYNMQLAKTQGDSHYAVAEQHFRKGIARPQTVSNNVEVKRITLSHRISLNAIKAVYESLENAELSTLVEGRNKWDLAAVTSCATNRCLPAENSWNFPWNDAHGKFCEKWIIPTHVLSAAYLSNLYLTTGNFEMCNKIAMEECRFALNASYSELFPMIFCPELASLFDENIQEVLGFLWICKHLLGGERKFEFCTCPLLFLIYARIQASFRIGDMKLVEVAINDFNLHRRMRSFRMYLYSYYYVLLEMAWRILMLRNGA